MPAKRRSTSISSLPTWSISAPAAAATPTIRCYVAPPPCLPVAKSATPSSIAASQSSKLLPPQRAHHQSRGRTVHYREDVQRLAPEASGDPRAFLGRNSDPAAVHQLHQLGLRAGAAHAMG